MKYYIAHPFPLRKVVLEMQKELEETGIEILNPFYTNRRDDVRKLDRMGIVGYADRKPDMWMLKPSQYTRLVERDLKWIDECDGLIVFSPFVKHGWGTAMEAFYAKRAGKKVFVLTHHRWTNHPWLLWVTDGDVYDSLAKLKEAIIYELKKNGEVS